MAIAKRRIRFTKRSIEALEPGEKRVYVHDSGQPGLVIAVMPTGRRTFFLYRWVAGKPERVRIGGWPETTVEQARKRAQSLHGSIAEGKNPAETRRSKSDELTLGAVWTVFLTHAKESLRTWAEYDRLHRLYLKRWDRRTLAAIHRRDVAALIQRIGRDSPVTANHVRALLSRLYGYALEHFDYQEMPPTKGVRRFPVEQRERFLDEHELARFFEALKSEPSRQMRDFFELAILTGARRGNLQKMRWEHIDLAAGVWTVPGEESKNGREMRIVLVPEAVMLLTQRKADLAEKRKKRGHRTGSGAEGERSSNPWVFPARHGRSGHMTDPRQSWHALLERAGIKTFRFHDLRRTLGSWQAASGVGLPIIGRSLGHLDPSSTKVYARVSLEPVRAAVGAAVAAMLQAAGRATTTEGSGDAKAS